MAIQDVTAAIQAASNRVAESTGARALERILVVLLTIIVSVSLFVAKEKNDLLIRTADTVNELKVVQALQTRDIKTVSDTITAIQEDRKIRIKDAEEAQRLVLQRLTTVETKVDDYGQVMVDKLNTIISQTSGRP